MSPGGKIQRPANVTRATLKRLVSRPSGEAQMDPAALGTRLASSVLSPLAKQLLTRDGPGSGLVDKPVRL